MGEKKKSEILGEVMERTREILGTDPAYYGEEGEKEVDRQLEKMGYNPKDFYKKEKKQTISY